VPWRRIMRRLSHGFDVLVIDEAAQASEVAVLPPLSLSCRRCVLIGDPQQLPATVISRTASALNYRSHTPLKAPSLLGTFSSFSTLGYAVVFFIALNALGEKLDRLCSYELLRWSFYGLFFPPPCLSRPCGF